MGQYFKAINLDRQQFVYPRDYGSGLKIMEHSWLFNPMVNAIMQTMAPHGQWHKCRLIWAGDYMETGILMNGINGIRKEDKSLYDCCRDEVEHSKAPPGIIAFRPQLADGPIPEYIADHDTSTFVHLAHLPEEDPTDPGWHIHPLPLLTCTDGGQYRGKQDHVGIWAGHRISAEFCPPLGFRQLIPAFTERRISS